MLIRHAGRAPRVDPTPYMEKITSQLSETLGSHFFDEPGVQLLIFQELFGYRTAACGEGMG